MEALDLMVKRSGFRVTGDNQITQYITYIEWDLGFDRMAKHAYIKRIADGLSYYGISDTLDVTSASNTHDGKMLSPIFVQVPTLGCSLEDALQNIPGVFEVPGLADWYYCRAISDSNKETILAHDCISDVFHNPDKGYGNTQAQSCVCYKLLYETNRLGILDSRESFLTWFHTSLERNWVM